MIGWAAVLVELDRVRALQTGQVAGHLDGHALEAEAQARVGMPFSRRAGSPADLALDPAYAEARPG